MENIVKFFFEIGMLKKTPRTGYQFLGSGKESVADHSFRTAIIGYSLASMESHVDKDKVLRMCLFHDTHEARTADHNYVNKRYVKVNETKALEDQSENLHFREELLTLFDEYNKGESAEAKLARDSDQLDMILELKEQLDIGNISAKDWLEFALKRLLTEAGRKTAAIILETHSADWWFHREKDADREWWVNGSEDDSSKEK